MLNSIDEQAARERGLVGYTLTLTQAAKDMSAAEYNAAVARFEKRLKRMAGFRCAILHTEFQERRAAHFHGTVFFQWTSGRPRAGGDYPALVGSRGGAGLGRAAGRPRSQTHEQRGGVVAVLREARRAVGAAPTTKPRQHARKLEDEQRTDVADDWRLERANHRAGVRGGRRRALDESAADCGALAGGAVARQDCGRTKIYRGGARRYSRRLHRLHAARDKGAETHAALVACVALHIAIIGRRFIPRMPTALERNSRAIPPVEFLHSDAHCQRFYLTARAAHSAATAHRTGVVGVQIPFPLCF